MNSSSFQRYHEFEADEGKLRRLTGFKYKEFEALYDVFQEKWQNHFKQFTLDGNPRTRLSSVRKNSIFANPRDALLFGLMYAKGGTNQQQLANAFGIDQPKASKYYSIIQKILKQTFETKPQIIPRRLQDSFNQHFLFKKA